MPELNGPRIHEDLDLFREAINVTAAQSGFIPRLIEKDYFCTVVLEYVMAADDQLVFKGGTCLAKVHAGFYRLSEDLDFAIPVPFDATRGDRSRCMSGLRGALEKLETKVSGLRVIAPLRGANGSTQYNAELGYTSALSDQPESIKLEVALREPLLRPAISGRARTLLLDPITGEPLVADFSLPCLAADEAMAEKLRAALSRREVAIRDFFDIDFAVQQRGLILSDDGLLEMLRQKLAVAGNDPVDVSSDRLAALHQQIDAQLKPVLRPINFARFDLTRAFAAVVAVANNLGSS